MSSNELLLKLCTFLSATVVINTFIYKVPQMYAIIHSGSSMGVSLSSVVLEWAAYSIMLTYQFAMEYPLETYLENTMMVLQDFLLTVVILDNRRMIQWDVMPFFLLYLIAFVSIGMRWLPDLLMLTAIGLTTPILVWSKADQLVEILMSGNPGSVSALTWFIASYDTAVRILTTVVITKDVPMFINLTSSEIFNVAIFVSVIYYNQVNANTNRRRSG